MKPSFAEQVESDYGPVRPASAEVVGLAVFWHGDTAILGSSVRRLDDLEWQVRTRLFTVMQGATRRCRGRGPDERLR